jgi:plasmid maintenance system antidote protein VapI
LPSLRGLRKARFTHDPRLHADIPPLHPGEFLREDFMKPLGLSSAALARALHVRVSPRFWMRLQTQYDLDVAGDSLAATIRREVRPAPRNRKTGELKPVTPA